MILLDNNRQCIKDKSHGFANNIGHL